MSKIKIVVKDVVTGTSTNVEAFPLFNLINDYLLSNNNVVLSLKNCPSMSSSFLNSSIGALIERHGFDLLKGRLSIIDYTPFMGQIIKDYINDLKALSIA